MLLALRSLFEAASVTGTGGVDYLYSDSDGSLLVDDVTGDPVYADGTELGATTFGASFAGTASEVITGTAAVAFAHPAIAGTGTERFTGTGSVTLAHPALAGTATERLTGTGSVTLAHSSLSGTGSERFTGTGAVTLAHPVVSGTAAETISGTGALTVAHPLLDASGTSSSEPVDITGTGAVAFGLSLAGIGTGGETAGSHRLRTASGGSVVRTVSGSGSLSIPAPRIAATGDVNDDELVLLLAA